MVIQLLVVSRLGIEKFLIILKTICQSNTLSLKTHIPKYPPIEVKITIFFTTMFN